MAPRRRIVAIVAALAAAGALAGGVAYGAGGTDESSRNGIEQGVEDEDREVENGSVEDEGATDDDGPNDD